MLLVNELPNQNRNFVGEECDEVHKYASTRLVVYFINGRIYVLV